MNLTTIDNGLATADGQIRTLIPLREDEFEAWQSRASEWELNWVSSSGFNAKPGEICPVPDNSGEVGSCLVGMQAEGWLYQLAGLPDKLPPGTYRLDCDWETEALIQAGLGWGLSAYRYDRYKNNNSRDSARLALDDPCRTAAGRLLEAQSLVRDLVNTPTEHMGPAELADAVIAQAEEFDAQTEVITGDELLTRDFPVIHAVGRASDRSPRLVRMTWGDSNAPLVALVGKGVCFDTGGLNLKSTPGMALMKKDMGGAAHALALARLVMQHELPVRLLLLVPAVENSVAGNAYRPGDILRSRKGLSIEIGNTDAEGRLVLADALAFATEQEPELIIDYATLTGAARVAMGPDIPPLFSNHDEIADKIERCSIEVEDPLWRLPLHQPYRDMIKSPIADLSNSASGSYGGCITAALFLEHFVTPDTPWVHVDTFAWNQADRPGRPKGGEALGLRAIFRFLYDRYGGS
jgi:leucyl aminopeptidase